MPQLNEKSWIFNSFSLLFLLLFFFFFLITYFHKTFHYFSNINVLFFFNSIC